MAKSKQTREELNAAAMLLGTGVWYDHRDHTFNIQTTDGPPNTVLDADTLEEWTYEQFMGVHVQNRKNMVRAGELGAADGPFILSNGDFAPA